MKLPMTIGALVISATLFTGHAFADEGEGCENGCKGQPVVVSGQQPGVEAFTPVNGLLVTELVIERVGVGEEVGR